MGYKLWFLLVSIDTIILILSFFTRNLILALVSLFLSLFLQHSSSKITFPKLTILGYEISDKIFKKK